MGSLHPGPTDDVEKTSALCSPMQDDGAWLDTLIGTSALGLLPSDRVDPIRRRLTHIRFDAVLSAIERAGQNANGNTEVALYDLWITARAGTDPLLYVAWFNMGISLDRAGDQPNAVIAYSNALALRPDMHAAAVNLGLLLEAMGQPDQALATWQRAVQPDDVRVVLKIQQGRLLETLGRLDQAEQIFRHVLLIDPAQPEVIHHWVRLRQETCHWPIESSDIPALPKQNILQAAGPLGILALTDDIDQQRDAAAAWVVSKTAMASYQLAPTAPYSHGRIRIGYLSSDFRCHAISHLIAALFERHDRGRFEVFGYCASEDDGTDLRERVLAALDQCRMIRSLTDQAAAQVIRDDEIDVLIDLNGITDGTRLPVLRWRPAPIQATWLGFVGSIPLPELDYLLCDATVVPPEYAASYQPRPLPIGNVFQCNDDARPTGPRLSRAEAGLPETKFVFCCFSKHYKITEIMFGAWMTILRRADNTMLWLAEDNPYSRTHLIAAAHQAGIATQRLIFCERTDVDLYLRRLGTADVFLDTFPYNAGTVASDAIRMRLPMITLIGRAFASRMAASLLHAAHAPRGIATSLPDYVEIAVRLATDPAAYAQHKAELTDYPWRQTIGNIASFTSEYEDTWCRIVHQRRSG